MSEYGIPIKLIQAGSVYEYNNGTRNQLDMKDAILINSLFKDYIVDHGLNIWKDGSTRDIICLNFSYGGRSYEDEIKHLRKAKRNIINNDEIDYETKREKLVAITKLEQSAEKNKDKYVKISNRALRTLYYKEGCSITYNTYNKKGKIIKSETIHYRMMGRSPGKAKAGKCLFICDRLYDIAMDYLYMGIKLPEKNAPIVEIGAYSSLTTSSIVSKIKVDPYDVLILKDVDSFFETNAISVELDEDDECIAVPKENYKLKNTLFDGQALIDSAIFPEWADGYILLRNHFCKMAAFCSNIQLFFKDYCREHNIDYEEYKLQDMFGNWHYAKDIKIITTENAVKWIKFDGITYDYWCDRVRKDNDSYFGIVKTSHQSKLGDVQQMSYQMVNALDVNTMDGVISNTVSYISDLKNDDEAFIEYLERNMNFSNDYEVLVALVRYDPDFVYSSYFKERRDRIIRSYVNNVKTGKVINNAENLTIVGNPYGMLMYTVGENPENDPTFKSEEDSIQCYTARFDDNEYLAEFRNPFNSCNNLGYLHNHYDWRFDKYFKLGRYCIAVNMVHTEFQDRNNGSDMDSDSIYTTNQQQVVERAKYCYANFPTIVNNIPKEKNIYDSSMESFARVDNNLAAAQMAIGESSNLAQLALTYTYNYDDQKYKDYVCILSVLAQIAIDNAKRAFAVDVNEEIRRIKADMNIEEHKLPLFWKPIKEYNDRRNNGGKAKRQSLSNYNEELICPMNFLYNYKISCVNYNTQIYPMDKFFKTYKLSEDRRKCIKVENVIEKYSFNLHTYNINQTMDEGDYILLRDDFDQMIEDIRNIYISKNYIGLMSFLINRAFVITAGAKRNRKYTNSVLGKNRPILLKTLYIINPEQFLKCFSKNIENKGNFVYT